MIEIDASFLRRVLVFDAATCLLMGTGLLAASGTVEALLAIPAAVSIGAGIVLLVFGAGVGLTAVRPVPSSRAVGFIVAINALWAIESVLALAFDWLTPNGWGQTFVIAQAVAVAVIAELQFIGLRGARRAIARRQNHLPQV